MADELFNLAFKITWQEVVFQDARLVVLNAMDAKAKGAEIHTRTKVISAQRMDGHWGVTMESTDTGETRKVRAKLIVNAGGPWVDEILQTSMGRNDAQNVRLVQGSHIVIRKKFEHSKAYFFQNSDERIFFAIPYEQDFTLVGTTDQDYEGKLCDVKITSKEINYLCEGASQYFKEPVTKDDIVWTYSGVRPLYDDGASKAQEATRDYVLRMDGEEDDLKVINIFGGKITTYRRLAESMLEKVEEEIGSKGQPWTKESTLPGGEFGVSGFADLVSQVRSKYSFLEPALCERLARSYGLKVFEILQKVKAREGLGEDFGHGLMESEVRYLIANEWAQTVDDVVWRRSKLGIRFSKDQMANLEAFMAKNKQSQKLAAE